MSKQQLACRQALWGSKCLSSTQGGEGRGAKGSGSLATGGRG